VSGYADKYSKKFKFSQPEHLEHGQAIKIIHNHLFKTIIHNYDSIPQNKLLHFKFIE